MGEGAAWQILWDSDGRVRSNKGKLPTHDPVPLTWGKRPSDLAEDPEDIEDPGPVEPQLICQLS